MDQSGVFGMNATTVPPEWLLIVGVLFGLLQTIGLSLAGWTLLQSYRNGVRIARIDERMQLKIAEADRAHAGYVTRAELEPQLAAGRNTMAGLTSSIDRLTAELRTEREARLRQEGKARE